MKATNYLFPLVAMAISATALAAQEQNPNAPRFEKIALPEKSIEVFYFTMTPASKFAGLRSDPIQQVYQ